MVHLINNGERYWLNDEDEALIKQMNVRFEEISALEELFFSAFAKPIKRDGEWIRLPAIMKELQSLPGFNHRKDNDLRKLGRMLTKINLKKRRLATGTEYWVKRV